MKMQFVGYGKTEWYDNYEQVPYEQTGVTEDLTEFREQGACVHRAELDNQPTYKGWLGPMWDGGHLRYETQEVYDVLSR